MVWSLSQDDDGLESVSPTPGPSPNPAPSAGRAASSPGSGTSAPRSASPGAPTPKRAEATLVLAERRLDRLRAEVKRRQRLFFLRRQGALLGWMLAGGAAVALGVFGARSLRSEEPEGTEGVPELASAAAAPEEVPVPTEAVVAAAPVADEAPPVPEPREENEENDSISLDEIPTRSAVEKPRRVVAKPKR